MILVFGSVNLDLVARVPRIPRPGETVLAPGYRLLHGGKGANQAVAAARARRDPAMPVRFAGAVGADNFGRAARENLRRNGVLVEALREVAAPTGCAFITVDEAGENAITVASGANLSASAADLPDAALEGLRVLVLQAEVPLRESAAVARRAREAGAQVVLNLAPTPGAGDAALLPDLLAASTVLVANEQEALAALALLGEAAGDAPGAMRRLVEVTGRAGIVTLGAEGARGFGLGGAAWHAPALPVRPVDTTGAGDTFVGVLAAGLAEGLALPEAAARACRAGSLACLSHGAQDGMPGPERIDSAA
ncbi:ribokinase [Roseomonas nepalensis]|uniref:Ribokinase n=1 Tax=Muricoccus nepalensis TaxID=1854500 RepID=A0A502FKI7_9PROT|nr:ribokinase [Roseomonas nepalensis]TPG49899.1 ribokinase [Roseomonas nepalensis]